jgi:hypothetical protein
MNTPPILDSTIEIRDVLSVHHVAIMLAAAL